MIHRAVLLCEGGVIRVGDLLLPSVGPRAGDSGGYQRWRSGAGLDEKQQLVEALQATNWMIYGERGAARLLGMSPENGCAIACESTGCADRRSPARESSGQPLTGSELARVLTQKSKSHTENRIQHCTENRGF